MASFYVEGLAGPYELPGVYRYEGRSERMVHVLAMITAKPGRRADALEALRANLPAVRAEEGCIEYGAATDADAVGGIQTPIGPDSFVVIEKWASMDALKAHAAADHMKAYAARTKDPLASRVIYVLSPAQP